MKSTATVLLEKEIGTIRPELHGHFLEHLGSAVYGGIWVGEDSSIPNIRGLRKMAVEYLQALKIPVLRWPGGCFADAYHWRDGIGPNRPCRINQWWDGVVEDNSFGTHEFMELCKLLGARPYLAGNLGSGSVAELHDWVEYCNDPFGSSLAEERIANGAPGPFGVRFWGIGNESWGCGGNLNPEEYAALYSRFATFLPTCGGTVPYLIAVGSEGKDLDWTRRFFLARAHRRYKPPLNAIAMHFYFWGKSKPTEYTHETISKQLGELENLEQAIIEQRGLIDSLTAESPQTRIDLVLDEWGTWDQTDESLERLHGKLYQENTMKDGIAAGLALNIFHRHADKLAMCNLAQMVNVLQAPLLASGDRCVRTPTYYALQLAMKHRGNRALEAHASNGISLSASRSSRELVLSFVNPDPANETEFSCKIPGARLGEVTALSLSDDDWNASNTFDSPERITPRAAAVHVEGGELTLELPPFSFTTAVAQLPS
jgi:alpha-N-arabinofuranosidase